MRNGPELHIRFLITPMAEDLLCLQMVLIQQGEVLTSSNQRQVE